MTDREKFYNGVVDALATNLGQKIGAQVRVQRPSIETKVERQYRVVIERVVDSQPRGFSSGNLKIEEAKKLLAFMNDCIDFGLIKVIRD